MFVSFESCIDIKALILPNSSEKTLLVSSKSDCKFLFLAVKSAIVARYFTQSSARRAVFCFKKYVVEEDDAADNVGGGRW